MHCEIESVGMTRTNSNDIWGLDFPTKSFSATDSLELGGPQLYNLKALPFTYDQCIYKLYNSVTVCFKIQLSNLPVCLWYLLSRWGRVRIA